MLFPTQRNNAGGGHRCGEVMRAVVDGEVDGARGAVAQHQGIAAVGVAEGSVGEAVGGIGFVVYIHLFQHTEYFLGVIDTLKKRGLAGEADLLKTQLTIIMSLVLGYVALAGMASNTVLEAVLREE